MAVIKKFKVNENELLLESDLAAEFPIYIYHSNDKQTLLYSDSITELLDDRQVPKPLKISDKGISFLLQSGVVPPPYTAYENIYIVGIGDKAILKTVNNKIEIDFAHDFPFMNEDRLSKDEMTPDVDNILKLIADATIKRIDPSKPTYLFHSAGKDSNTIALALAKAEYQDNVTLITHKSKGDADESEISKSIAEQLGFKHKILYEVDKLKEEHKESISNYFINAPFPCTDSVTLAYPLYVLQVPELIGANIIFGDGNDSHMISPPSKKEQFILPYSSWFSKMGFIRKLINSESKLNGLLRTPAEWFGTSGLSDKDCKDIFNNIVPTYAYWAEESKVRSNWDVFNFKSDIFSTRVITEKMIRKLHNFVDVNNSKIILPFMEERTANYFAKMPEEYLFDRNNLTNKRVLRDLLKDKIGLDSDKIGKMGWVYDKGSVVEENIKSFQKEIFSCTYWDQSGINKVIRRFERNITKGNSKSSISKSWIYRLYLISSWLNNCKYVE